MRGFLFALLLLITVLTAQTAYAATCQTGGRIYDVSDVVWSKHHKTHLYCAGDNQWRYLAQWGLTSGNALVYSGGNVGIGVDNPQDRLEVAGTIRVNQEQGDGAAIKINERGTGFGAKLVWLDADKEFAAVITKRPDHGLGFYTNGNHFSGEEKMTLSGDGRVGIGTNDPKAKLDVLSIESQATIAATAQGAWSVMASKTYSDNHSSHFIGHRSRGTIASPEFTKNGDTLASFEGRSLNVISVPSGGPGMIAFATEDHSASVMGGALRFRTIPNGTTQSVDRMWITSDGDVGIGTSAPTQKLQVNALIDVTNNRILRVATPTAATDAANKAYVDSLGNRTCANAQILKFQSGSWQCAADNSGGGSGGGNTGGGVPVASGRFVFSFADGPLCGSGPSSPCVVDISAGNFTSPPSCSITMQNSDGTSYTENVVIRNVSTTQLRFWRGQYLSQGTSLVGYWICIQGSGFTGGGGSGEGSGDAADNLGNHTASQNLDMATHAIVNVKDPVNAQDAVTKSYVDMRVPICPSDDTLVSNGTGWICSSDNYTDCTAPWGGVVAHLSSIIAYQAATVPYGNTCASQTRSCNDGVLSGSYTHQSCTVGSPSNCTLNGVTVEHLSSIVAYQAATVPYGNTCASQTRSCNDGVLSGSYTHQSCTVGLPSNCTLDGVTVAHGSSRTFYAYEEHANCAGNSQSRSCNNGTLSGSSSYQYADCDAPPVPACATGPVGTVCPDGAIYAGSVEGVRFYAAPSDESGTYSWNNGSSNSLPTNATSLTDGLANTNILVGLTDTGAPYKAAVACRARGANWYLPSKDELNVMYSNRTAIGGFSSSNYYLSSSEYAILFVWIQRFSDGSQALGDRFNANRLVRCVRR